MPPLKTLCKQTPPLKPRTQTITLDMEPEKQAQSSEILQNAVLQALTTKLDLDGLAETLVEQVTARLVESITLADLAEAIAEQHRDEIKTRLARAVLDRVRGA
jgi:hypothetical protein